MTSRVNGCAAVVLAIGLLFSACESRDQASAPTATPVTYPEAIPDPALVNQRPHPWLSSRVARDRKTVWVRFAEGASGCGLFAKSSSTEEADALIITLFVGDEPNVDCSRPRPGAGLAREAKLTFRESVAPSDIVDGARR